jgi:D-beta-D-heptose 7-phosphate kinase/D-beta-D-heptose 1-phosphate adenosyltransferase
MKLTIPNFSKGRVLVAGDLMLDRYWSGPTSRISPEAPVPVTKVESNYHRAGGAGNVALNIAALGGQVELLGYVGSDEPARLLKSSLEEANINCHFEPVENIPTVTKLRVMSRNQQLMRLDFEAGFHHVDSNHLIIKYKQLLQNIDAVVLSDYGKGTLQPIQALITAARDVNIPVLVDPKGSDFSKYKQATLITPNQSEFEAVVGLCDKDEVLFQKGEALRQELELEALLVTRSEKGMVLFSEKQKPVILPTRAKEVFDVTGAGDTVIGTMAAAIAAKVNYIDSMQLANLAAGVVVAKSGTATTSIKELQLAMLEHEPLKRGVVDENELIKLIEKSTASGEKIVMTNGCFDILHAGHVTYLSQARELGDRLIVAVNDDASVKRLKGEERPINSLIQRMAVLSGLESVDWVVSFSEDTPERLINLIMPNILVKGGDYKPEEIVGGESVKQSGGEVIVLSFVDNCSTTGMIELIRKKI